MQSYLTCSDLVKKKISQTIKKKHKLISSRHSKTSSLTAVVLPFQELTVSEGNNLLQLKLTIYSSNIYIQAVSCM
jgi:hypothetical protein